MKKTKGLLLSLATILVLSACGQSNNEELENNNEGAANAETSEEMNENEEENNSNENIEANENEDNGNNNALENNNNNNNDEEQNEEANEEVNNEQNNANEEEVAMIDSVTLYFSDDQLLQNYRVNSEVSVTSDEAGGMEAMELWAAGPTQDGLYPLLPEGASVDFVEFHDNIAHVSFSSDINEANLGSSGELMLTEQIALMMEQFGYNQTQILIDGDEVDEFLGHMDLSEPIEAGNPEDYEWME
ncbi:GerMN domain-containing protein [Salipaludibacillus daqingensis]|uniref:GerMN domain-containing protein n=1 Tax=Salipaludibacillus daqingensis TaxID=3041001 RepID=UPI0024769D18|nr:GerMN domain-containing protein [Salipaludibacillus daqingensis]